MASQFDSDGLDEGNRSAPLSPTPSSDNSVSASPSTSFSSDKENRTSHTMSSSHVGKRKTNALSVASPNSRSAIADTSNKRRRVSEKQPLSQETPTAYRRRRPQNANNTEFYDPDQDPEERRAIRKSIRDLTTHFNDSRSEFLQPESRGIRETLDKANEYYKSVKQTSDATLDSRLLVSAAELSYKRTAQAVLGDAASGIDVDEFVSKCISFMRGQGGGAPSLSQHRSRRISGRQTQDAEEDSDEEDDTFNWDCLGRLACFPNNLRPSLSGFLLGPLSVQKRVRQQSQRRARQERVDPSQAVRPQELRAEDLEKQESANLTTLCTNIRSILVKTQRESEALVEKRLIELSEETGGDVPDDTGFDIMNEYAIGDDAGVSLFRFCINPRSFGQTIENLFYLSFLVRDGSVGLSMDSHGILTLLPSEPALPSEARQQGLEKQQAVFSLDFDTWEALIETFDIKESIIPHRKEEKEQQGNTATATTWQA